jgi:hypothetical protein
MSRFDYVKYDDVAVMYQEGFKREMLKLEDMIKQIGAEGIPGGSTARAKATAITKLEEFYMWAGKAVRDDQIDRNGSAPLQEERKDG